MVAIGYKNNRRFLPAFQERKRLQGSLIDGLNDPINFIIMQYSIQGEADHFAVKLFGQRKR